MAFLLPCVSMGIALLLHLAQWVTSWISSAVARSRVGVEACPDLTDSFGVDPGAIEVVDRSPFGFVCQASTYDGGTTMIEHSGVTSAMFATSAGLAALSVAALLGVLLAFAVTRLIGATRSGRTDGAVGRWALLLVAVGVFVLPLMMLGQYLQWYSKFGRLRDLPGIRRRQRCAGVLGHRQLPAAEPDLQRGLRHWSGVLGGAARVPLLWVRRWSDRRSGGADRAHR